MIKIYPGMPSCPDCEYVHHQIENRSDEFESIDIGEHVEEPEGVHASSRQQPRFR